MLNIPRLVTKDFNITILIIPTKLHIRTWHYMPTNLVT